MLQAPAWKRLLGGALFVAGGGGFGAWGAHDVVVWIGALHAGAATIETASTMLGIAPLGTAIAMVGPLMMLPAVSPGWRKTAADVAFMTILGFTIVGILLATIGSLAVRGVMRHHGYHLCDVWQGTRMSVTTWAAKDRPCPTPEA